MENISFNFAKIFIDSQAAILALSEVHIKSLTVYDTKVLLNELADRGDLTLVWLKSHVGIEGNERADDMAKQGGKDGELVEVGMPISEIKNKIKKISESIWKDEWQNYKGARMSKLFYEGPDKNKAQHFLQMSSYKVGRLIRLLSGHNNLNYSQSLIDDKINPLCRLCEEEDETFDHWVTECPVIGIHRTDIFLVPDIYSLIPNEWSVAEITKFCYLDIINSVVENGLTFNNSELQLGRAYELEPD